MANYFAPAFRVTVNGAGLEADVSKNIQQVSVTTKPGALDSFTLTLVNPYPEMRWTHTDDAKLFSEGASVIIELGYVDDLRKVFDGEIRKISPAFPESGMPTVNVEGHTRLHWLQGEPKTRTFQTLTDSQIVAKIAQENHLTPQCEDTQVPHQYVIQSNESDLEFVRKRACLIHFEVLVDGRTLIFRKGKEDQPKEFTLVWGYPQLGLAPTLDTLPLKSFSPSMNTVDQPNSVVFRGYDPKTKKEVIGRAGIGDETRKMGSDVGPQVSQNAFRRPLELSCVGPVASKEELQQQARAMYNERAMSFVQGTGATIGLPGLRAGKVVELLGLGPRFSGLYYVEEATHTLGSGGYETTFSVKRNAVK